MKKLLVTLMMGTLCLGMITGCGKSEAEKEQEEMAQQIREEAAEDGVDLDSMIEDEMAAYEEKHAANEEERAQQAASQEELQEKYFADLDNLLADYEASTDASEIQKLAEEYNTLYTKMEEEAEAANISTSGYEAIPRKKYLTRMAWFNTAKNIGSDETEMWVYHGILDDSQEITFENTDAVMLLVEHNVDNVITKITVVKNGMEALELNCSDFGIEPYEISAVDGSNFILNEIKASNFTSYLFDFSGSSITLVKDNAATGEDIYIEETYGSEWSMANQEGFEYLMSSQW